MGIIDRMVDIVKSEIGYAVDQARGDVKKIVNGDFDKASKEHGDSAAGISKSEKFTFFAIPTSVEDLKLLPEASLDTPHKTAALSLAVLCNYERDPEGTYAMLDVLKGPEPLTVAQKQVIKEQLTGKYYKPFSFFEGAAPFNEYRPSTPYTISIGENPYSYSEENRATLYVVSSGADQKRSIKLRRKPSTGQWFLVDMQCLSDIKKPAADDPWA